ncbi:MAG: BCAM0308 family protein [Pseudomonadota bacterium]
MSSRAIPPGFHPVRRDRLQQEQVHDAYKSKGKPAEPTACPQCGAVFHAGRWQWMQAPENAHQQTCPACHRIADRYPAGFVSLSGEFFRSHQDEVLHLAQKTAEHERAEHPLKRIIATEAQDGSTLITTTDIHLARGIGEALHHAFQGELEFHYNEAENLLRVHWTR